LARPGPARDELREVAKVLCEIARPERFRAKWAPVHVKKTRQNKNLEAQFGSPSDQASGGCTISPGSAAVPDSACFVEKTSSISQRMVA
jgi:hypothetical protein